MRLEGRIFAHGGNRLTGPRVAARPSLNASFPFGAEKQKNGRAHMALAVGHIGNCTVLQVERSQAASVSCANDFLGAVRLHRTHGWT